MIRRLDEFKRFLQEKNTSARTSQIYVSALRQYYLHNKDLDKVKLLKHREYLIKKYQPATANLKIIAINSYLKFLQLDNYKLRTVRQQVKKFVENVISDADLKELKFKLKKENKWTWYFVIRYLASTGARISELLQLKVNDVVEGYQDIYGKGGKLRRIYFPTKLKNETIIWLMDERRDSGFVFQNERGKQLTPRGVSMQLKTFAQRYGINPKVMHPHSFRHRFAKNFLNKSGDISLLADLLGHESIETTRIYLRKSTTEQRNYIDKIVTW